MRRRLPMLPLLCAIPLLVGFGPIEPGSMSPAGVAMAGVGVAGGAGTTALYTNPAGLSAHRSHNLEMGFGRQDGRSTFFAQSVDGQAPGFAQGGTGYAYHSGTLPDGRKRTGHDWRTGLSLSGRSDAGQFMLGFSARYLDLDYSAKDDLAARNVKGWTGDLGVAMALSGNVRVGFVWRNALDVDAVEAPEQLAAGLALAFERVLIAGDVSWGVGDGGPQTTGLIYRAGLAVSVIQQLQLRAGYRYSELADLRRPTEAVGHVVTGGFGFRFGMWSADAAVAVPIGRGSETQVVVALNYYLPALR